MTEEHVTNDDDKPQAVHQLHSRAIGQEQRIMGGFGRQFQRPARLFGALRGAPENMRPVWILVTLSIAIMVAIGLRMSM